VRLCGPKFLRGIEAPCDGSCCGLGKDGKPDPVLTEKLNRRANAWRRILGTDKSSDPNAPRSASCVTPTSHRQVVCRSAASLLMSLQ
jgi:hypothetical protein